MAARDAGVTSGASAGCVGTYDTETGGQGERIGSSTGRGGVDGGELVGVRDDTGEVMIRDFGWALVEAFFVMMVVMGMVLGVGRWLGWI